jgi:hypothetical protein
VRTVLITGARAPVAVDLARAFAAAGYRPHLADSVTPWAARWSRAVAGIHHLPPPRTEFPAFATALADLAARLDPIAIVPTCEEVFYVAAALPGAPTLAPPLPRLRTLHSKIAFADHARALGIAAPDTWRVESRAAIDTLRLDPGDLVLKPEFSRFATHTLIRPTRDQLASIEPSPARSWAAQRFVAGEELCLWSFARAGRIVAAVTYRPRWRHGKAAAYAFETVDCPGALDIARRVAAEGALTGHLSFDLIVTPDGTVVPIECNPRAVSGLHLFDAQADLARAMLGDIETAKPAAGLRYLGPAMALLGLPAAIGSGTLGRFRRDLARGNDVVGRPGDRRPALGALVDAGRFAARALASLHSAASATTDDIEWNGGSIA